MMFLFSRRKPHALVEASRMGFRSKLVLAKLGFELAERYEEVIGEPPEEIRRALRRLESAE